MDELKQTLLSMTLNLLSEWLPFSRREYLTYYEGTGSDACVLETLNASMHALLFSWPVLNEAGRKPERITESAMLERFVILVYDQDQPIADCSALHCRLSDFLKQNAVYDALSAESDWMYLEHYVLSGICFPALQYPWCQTRQPSHPDCLNESGDVLLYSNAYVSRKWRRQGIFHFMVQMMQDAASIGASGRESLYSVLSLDPDIAQYGPDAVSQPYHYSFAKDEPDRKRNAAIVKQMGFYPIRLEETAPQKDDDGTKLWFAVKKEEDLIVETEDVS